MATIVNTRDVILQAASPRVLTVTLPSNVTLPSAQVTGLGTLATKSSVSISEVSGLGALAVKNKVDVALDLTAPLTASDVSGLGALAVLNQLNLGTQTTGQLDATTKVTNLGSLAFANSVAANQIGAGTLAAGVIYSGSILASQITTGTLTAATVDTSNYIRAYGSRPTPVTVTGNSVYPTVYGESSASAGVGVVGVSTSPSGVTRGVLGYSTYGTGVVGWAASTGDYGVLGQCQSASGVGVYASNGAGGTALYVNGPMQITSTDMVTNLNADKLDGLHAAAFAKLSTPVSGENILRTSSTRGNLGSSPLRSIVAYIPVQVGASDTYYVALY